MIGVLARSGRHPPRILLVLRLEHVHIHELAVLSETEQVLALRRDALIDMFHGCHLELRDSRVRAHLHMKNVLAMLYQCGRSGRVTPLYSSSS